MDLFRFILRRKPFKGQFRIFVWLFNNRKLKRVQETISPIDNDFKIFADTINFIDASIYYLGDYEPWLKKYFKELIKPGDTVLDVGANIGFHSIYFSTLVGISGRVVAVEPIKQNFKALEHNVHLNKSGNFILVEKALANENKVINVYINDNAKNPGAHSLLNEGIANTEVHCITGDYLLRKLEISKLDFIKIDVEGFELEVLKGLESTIRTHKPIIIFEYDKAYQLKSTKNPEAIFSLLASYEYSFESVDGYGKSSPFTFSDHISSAEIIAYP